MKTQPFLSGATTHPGAKRPYNQDAFVNRPDQGLWAVADGAGGHKGGEVAAGMLHDALESIPPSLPASELLAQVRLKVGATHHALRSMAEQSDQAIQGASTIVVLILRNDHYACLWAGDSRCYVLRDAMLRQVSHDHSLVQELVDSGAIRPEDAESHPRSNVITRAVGADVDELVLDKVSGRIQSGDRFLLCSDGLYKCLRESDIASVMADSHGVPPAQALIAAALAMNADDNVTAIIIEIH